MKSCWCVCLFIAFVALSPVSSEAGESFVILNGISHHIDSSYDWNESNTGLGIEYETPRSRLWSQRLVVNAFRDSNDDMSYMFGAGLHRNLLTLDRFGDLAISAGATAFLMSREDKGSGQVFPGILPSLTIGNKHYGMNLTYLPRVAVERMSGASVNDPTLDGVVFLQFRIGASRFYAID